MCVCVCVVLIKSTHSSHKVQFFCYPTKLSHPISKVLSPSLSFSFILLNHSFNFVTGRVGMGVGPSTGEWVATSGDILKEHWLSCSQQPSSANIWGEICWAPPCSMLDFCLTWFGTYFFFFACSHSCCKFMCETAPSRPENNFTLIIPWVLETFFPTSVINPHPWEKLV